MLAIHGSNCGRRVALLDSAIAMRKLAADTNGWRSLAGQRVPMLVVLQRPEEALVSAAFAREARSNLPAASERVALIDWHSGLAAMAAGRTAEAVRYFAEVVEVDAQADSGTLQGWRMVMARCALGAALARAARISEAGTHLREACPALEKWGRADSSVKIWGAVARAKLSS